MKYVNLKTLVVSFLILATSLMSISSFAGGEKRSQRLIEKVTDELNLNEAQQNSLNEVVSSFFATMEAQHDKRKEMRDAKQEEAKTFWSKENLIAEDIINFLKVQHTERVAEMEQSLKPTVEKLVAFHATLDAEQKEKFAELAATKMPFMSRGFGGRHHRGGKYHH